MDDSFYRELLETIETVGRISVNQEIRVRATRRLNEWLTRMDLMTYLHHMLLHVHKIDVQFMSLKLLEDWMFEWWRKFPTEQQVQIRQGVLVLVTENAGLWATSRPLRAKLSRMLAGIAVRHYPNLWGACLGDLVALGEKGKDGDAAHAVRQEMSILSMRYFFEDVMDNDFSSSLPSRRREEILLGIQTEASPLLAHVYSLICQLATNTVQAGVEDTNASKHYGGLCADGLHMLIPLVSVVKPDVLCRAPHDVVAVALQFLPHVLLRDAALLFLREVCQHEMMRDCFVTLIARLPTPLSAIPLDDDGRFSNLAGEVAFSLIATNTSLIDTGYLGDAQRTACLNTYLAFLCDVFAASGVRLAATAARQWLTLLSIDSCHASTKTDLLPALSDTSGVVSKLLPPMIDRLGVRAECGEDEVLPSAILAADEADEFNSEADYLRYFSELRSAISSLVSRIAARAPMGALLIVQNRLSTLVATSSSSPDSPGKRATEALVLVVEGVIDGLPSSVYAETPEAAAFWQELGTIVDAALAWNPESSFQGGKNDGMALVDASTRLLEAITPVLSRSTGEGTWDAQTGATRAPRIHGWIVSLFSRLFDRVMRAPRTAHSLSAITAQLAPALASGPSHGLMEQISERALAILDETGSARADTPEAHTLHLHMLECVVGLAESGAAPEQRRAIYQRILYPSVISIVSAAQRGGVLSEATALMHAIHDTPGVVRKVTAALSVLGACAARVNVPVLPAAVYDDDHVHPRGGAAATDFTMVHLAQILPFADVWSAVLPALPGMVASVLGLWSPSMRSAIAGVHGATAHDLYHLSAREAHRLGKQHKLDIAIVRTHESSSSSCPTLAPVVSLVLALRQEVLAVCKMASMHGALFVHPAGGEIVTTVSHALPTLEHWHLVPVLKMFVEPVLVHAPKISMAAPASQLAEITLVSCIARLHIAWSDNIAAAGTHSGVSTALATMYAACGLADHPALGALVAGEEEMSMLRRSVLLEVTAAVTDLLAACLALRGVLATDISPMGDGVGGSPGKSRPTSNSTGVVDSTASKHAEMHAKRQCAERRLLASPTMRGALCKAIVCLIETPDRATSLTAVGAAEKLLLHAATWPEVCVALARDSFAACMRIVTAPPPDGTTIPYTHDNMWAILNFMEKVYTRTVLGIDGSCPMGGNPAKNEATRMHNWSSTPSRVSPAITALGSWSRDILLGIPGMTQESVARLDQDLSARTLKKRRATFRDLLTSFSLNQRGSGQSKVGNVGSAEGTRAAAAAAGYATKRQQRRTAEKQQPEGESDNALGALFS